MEQGQVEPEATARESAPASSRGQRAPKAAQVLRPGTICPSGCLQRGCSLPGSAKGGVHLPLPAMPRSTSEWKQQDVLHAEAPRGYGHLGSNLTE